VFNRSEDVILVADKSGDVFQFSIDGGSEAASAGGELLLGHVSMVLDMVKGACV
jgi:hypothetical protein